MLSTWGSNNFFCRQGLPYTAYTHTWFHEKISYRPIFSAAKACHTQHITRKHDFMRKLCICRFFLLPRQRITRKHDFMRKLCISRLFEHTQRKGHIGCLAYLQTPDGVYGVLQCPDVYINFALVLHNFALHLPLRAGQSCCSQTLANGLRHFSASAWGVTWNVTNHSELPSVFTFLWHPARGCGVRLVSGRFWNQCWRQDTFYPFELVTRHLITSQRPADVCRSQTSIRSTTTTTQLKSK